MRYVKTGALLTALCVTAACDKPADQPVAPSAPSTTVDAGSPPRRFAAVDAGRLLNADAEPGSWMSYGRTYNEQRFSPLTGIDKSNVTQLGLAWFADFDTRRQQESTPVVVDGVLYVTSAWSKVFAYDAKTGAVLWKYDPKVPGEWAVNACCDVVNRGVAVWEGKVFVGTIDGRLIALDAATGESLWDIYTVDRTQPYSITGAPRVVRGMVLIGQGGAEFGVRGYISAYDVQTGTLKWRWYTVPGNPADGFENEQMERAAQTWHGQWWKTGGGGTVWDSINYDPVTDLLYVGVGNGSPWPREIRSPGGGDNLFLSSIVALKPDTGEYVWHYQTVNGDSWDYTAVQQIITADIELNGQQRHVVMQAPKNGFFYVLDAASGELLSAEPFVPVNWATGVDMTTGRPIENPDARYSRTGKGYITQPFYGGGHNWHPMSYSPDTGLVYIPAVNANYGYVATETDDNPMGQKLSISFSEGNALYEATGTERISNGYLLAWDPVKQQEVWRVSYDSARGGGVLTTASDLLFQGNTLDNEFAAFDASSGERLWRTPVQTGIVAAPVTYAIDGEQYVAVVAGARQVGDYYAPNYSRLLVYKLGGDAVLPPTIAVAPRVLNPPAAFGDEAALAHGQQLYDRYCGVCHGTDGQSRGMFPDLRYSAALNSPELFKAIVIDGVRKELGMVSFASALSLDDAEAVRAYVTQQAQQAAANQ